MWQSLLKYKRNNLTEICVHGAVSWSSPSGTPYSLTGEKICYMRSLAKPLQMKAVATELDNQLNSEEKALSLSSHNGEEKHLEILKGMLAEKDYHKLLLSPAAPLLKSKTEEIEPNKLCNACSGKHAAIIKACAINQWSSHYIDSSHNYHQAYLKQVRRYLGEQFSPNHEAIDGCNLPTISMTLNQQAQIYAFLNKEKDKDWIWSSMVSHPFIIGGTKRLDSHIMNSTSGEVLAKEGADGLLGLSLRNKDYPDGLGILIKIAHGTDFTAMNYIAQGILKSLGYDIRLLVKGPDKQTVHINPELVPTRYREKLLHS